MLIHDYLDYWARRAPDGTYATDGTTSITWTQMRSWSNRIGTWLSDEVPQGQRFGIVAKNSLEILAVYFGASRAGVVPVPLNTRLAPPEWEYILADSGAALVIAEHEFTAGIDAIASGTALTRRVAIGAGTPATWDAFEDRIAGYPDRPPQRDVHPDDPLYQMYTSGTTGRPKGAVLTQRAVTDNIAQGQIAIGISRKNAMLLMPLFHAGAAMGAFLNAACGNTSRIVRDFDAAQVADILRAECIAVVTFVPAMIQALLQVPGVRSGGYPDLELIMYGAAPISTEILAQALEVFGCDFVQVYGMTELGSSATALDPEDHLRALAGEPELLLSAGRPTAGTQVRVVDEAGTEVLQGQVGEIVVRGPQMMREYWHQPEATAQALRGGWMHTGDAGWFDPDGYLYISGRVKDMIVSGGENIYPREVEDALFKLNGVADAAVIGVPDERWGESPKAVVVLEPGATLTADEVIAHCRRLLAGYKCPKSVDFADILPRNAIGKVAKEELRAPFWTHLTRGVN